MNPGLRTAVESVVGSPFRWYVEAVGDVGNRDSYTAIGPGGFATANLASDGRIHRNSQIVDPSSCRYFGEVGFGTIEIVDERGSVSPKISSGCSHRPFDGCTPEFRGRVGLFPHRVQLFLQEPFMPDRTVTDAWSAWRWRATNQSVIFEVWLYALGDNVVTFGHGWRQIPWWSQTADWETIGRQLANVPLISGATWSFMPRPVMSLGAYAVLGVDPRVNDEILRSHYHELMKQLHPDMSGVRSVAATERFTAVQNAWERVCTTEARTAHDAGLVTWEQMPASIGWPGWWTPAPAQPEHGLNVVNPDPTVRRKGIVRPL